MSGRSRMFEKNLKRKNKERIACLKPYLAKGMQILEIGCAEGSMGEEVKRKFPVIYSGVEPSMDARFARTKLDKVWDSMNSIPKKQRFDLILGFHVVEHVYNIQRFIVRLHALLKDDGVVVLEAPNHSGSRRLSWDFNREHTHLFTPLSIISLLEKNGFNLRQLSTGHYESEIYNDSIRAVCDKKRKAEYVTHDLVERFYRYLGRRCVIYGAGGDLKSLVLPYIKRSRILAVIDSAKDKIKTTVSGHIIQGPEQAGKYKNERFLVATLRYQDEITDTLIKKGVCRSNIVTLEDILGPEET